MPLQLTERCLELEQGLMASRTFFLNKRAHTQIAVLAHHVAHICAQRCVAGQSIRQNSTSPGQSLFFRVHALVRHDILTAETSELWSQWLGGISHLDRRFGSVDGLGRVLRNRCFGCGSFLDREFLSGGSPGLLSGSFFRSTFFGAVRLYSRSLLS